MSIQLSNNSNNDKSTSGGTLTASSGMASSLYGTKTLMCKNNCGYYGNSTQYEGYCSICYRKLKTNKNHAQVASSYLSGSPSASSLAYDDTSSLLSSSFSSSSSPLSTSHSFSNHYSLENYQERNTKKDSDKTNKSIWNDHSNFNKFLTKKDSRRPGSSSNAIKQFLRRPSTSTIAAAVDSAVSKVAVTAADMLGTDSSGSTSTIFENINTFAMNSNDSSINDFNSCLNRLVISPSSASTITSSMLLNGKNSVSSSSNNNNNTNLSALTDFEEQFRMNFPNVYSDLMKQMKQFVEKFIERLKRNDQQTNINNGNKQYEVVQEFYKKIYKYIVTSATIRAFLEKSNTHLRTQSINENSSSGTNNSLDDHSEKLYEAIMIMVESFITNNIYDYVFPVIMTEFEDQDMNLQKRIRGFYWITNEMIGTCIDENSIFYRESYEEAINYIVEMDSKRTAHEKMLCITECSKNIYKAINISANIRHNINEATTPVLVTTPTGENQNPKSTARSVASADDYLPAFIYIVLKANPTMLYSNMNFISRFAFEKRVLQGEHAYHFCSLNAIITHIENLNAQHLNMTQEKFEDYCNGLIDVNSSSNVLKLIQSNLKILSELKDKQKLLRQETKKLQTDMSSFKELMESKFNSCLDRNQSKFTEFIEGYVRKNFLDDNKEVLILNDTQTLPQPLKPQSLAISNNEETEEKK